MVGDAERLHRVGQLADAVLAEACRPGRRRGARARGRGSRPPRRAVQVTSVTWAPSATYFAIVAPLPIVSSSGWACTSSSRRSAVGEVTKPSLTRACAHARRLTDSAACSSESLPRQYARTPPLHRSAHPARSRVSPDGARVVFLRSAAGNDPVGRLWELDVAHAARSACWPTRRRCTPAPRSCRRRSAPAASGCARARRASSATPPTRRRDRRRVRALRRSLRRGPAGRTPPSSRRAGPVIDPRPSPDGRHVAYVSGRLAARRAALDGGERPALAGRPRRRRRRRARRVRRRRGDGPARAASGGRPTSRRAARRAGRRDARCQQWYIADPAHPERRPRRSATPPPARPTPTVDAAPCWPRRLAARRRLGPRARSPTSSTSRGTTDGDPLLVGA